MKDRTPRITVAAVSQADTGLDNSALSQRSAFDRLALILVLAVLLVGIGLRLNGLTDHTIDHNEIYVPGVRLPEGISIPGPRLTLRATIINVMSSDLHPHGYYLLMFPWTKCFGFNPLAIRLPSVIIDAATILLIYLLGARLGFRKAGVLASFLWATGGLPVYLAQEARMYTLVSFLSVLTTALLVESYRGDRSRQRWVAAGYVIAVLVGLSTSHFFWLVLMAHMLYVQFGPTPLGCRAAPQAQWQVFVVALASPLFAIAAFQARRGSYLSADVLSSLQAYFRLLYVWYGEEGPTVNPWLAGGASLGCVLLLFIGIVRMRCQTRAVNQSTEHCPRWLLPAAAAVGFVAIEVFAWLTYHYGQNYAYLAKRIATCGVFPLLALALGLVVRRGGLARWLVARVGAPLGSVWIVAFLAIAPVVLLALISIMMPLIAGRTVSMFAPHLMLIVSIGAVHLCRTFSLRAVAVLFLLSLNTLGFFGYRGQLHSPVDYAELATEALPNAQPADLWFIRKSWVTTPIFYYLDPDRHTFVAGDYAQAILRRPCARVWVLGFEGLEPQPAAMASLNGHHHQKHVEARGIYADLYVLGTDDAMQDAGEAPDPNEQ